MRAAISDRSARRLAAARRLLEQAQQAVRNGARRRTRIDVAHRTNVRIAANIGGDGRATEASATQVAPIDQGRES